MDGDQYKRALEALKARLHAVKTTIHSTRTNQPVAVETIVEETTKQPETQEFDEEEVSETVETAQTTPQQTTQIHIFTSKKEQIKQQILDELSTGQRSTILLKKTIVDSNRLCSKASFYRYIQELKQEQQLTIIKISDKEFCIKIEK